MGRDSDNRDDRGEDLSGLRARIWGMEDRCDKKDVHIREMTIQITRLETTVKSLSKHKVDSEDQLEELYAWKNKALGYISALAIASTFLVDAIRNTITGAGGG